MTHGSLFSGIGGFDLAAEWMGWDNKFHCEWMEFPRKVLDYYWPDADSHIDICNTNFKKYANQIDVLTGGFPCQPFSLAGKRKGTDDERYLWGEMLRAIQEIKPKFVIAENVFGITNIDGGLVFEQVCLDLESEGYEVQPFIIPACAKNAPHRRERVWFIAQNTNQNGWGSEERKEESKIGRFRNISTGDNERICISEESITNTNGNGLQQCHGKYEKQPSEGGVDAFDDVKQDVSFNSDSKRFKRSISSKFIGQISNEKNCDEINLLSNGRWGKELPFQKFPTQSPICGGDDGLPTELDGITFSKWRAESIKGYGNAIVPQVAFEIFKAIQQYELLHNS